MSKRAFAKSCASLFVFLFSTALYVEEFFASPSPEVPDECCAKSECDQCVDDEAKAMAIQARVLSGEKLGQLVCRLQRHSGRSRESCWRFVLQIGLKIRDEHRRWTEGELDTLRDTLPPIRSRKRQRCWAKREVSSLRATTKRIEGPGDSLRLDVDRIAGKNTACTQD